MKFPLSLLAASAAALTPLLALPALAQETPAKPAEEQSSKEAKDDKKVCKRVSMGMGSRRAERVCLTPEEWRKANHQ